MILKIITYSFLLILFFSLIISNVRLKIKNTEITIEMFKTNVNKNIQVEELIKQLEQSKNENNDDFLTFVSKSRDMAFEYIENVQTGILEFIDTVGPDIDYMDQYRPPIILEESAERLVAGYKKLKSLVPDDYGRIDT
jgi:hypothetical protein